MRVSDKAVEIMPIVNKINFAGRASATVDMHMSSKFTKGKALDGQFTSYRQVVNDMKTAYKTEKGFLKMSVLTGKILDWTG
jgi:hypothetical protein